MFEFPSDNVGPLINKNWKISMRLDPVGKGWIHDSLRGRSNSYWFLKITVSVFCYPSNLGFESIKMTFFFFEIFFRDKHWEITVAYSGFFELGIQMTLDLLPNKIRIRLENITSRNIVVVNESSLDDYLRIPLWEVRNLISSNFKKSLSFSIFLSLGFFFLFNYWSTFKILK